MSFVSSLFLESKFPLEGYVLLLGRLVVDISHCTICMMESPGEITYLPCENSFWNRLVETFLQFLPHLLSCLTGNDIYSTIRKYQSNGRIPRFRRVRGAAELYTSDTVMTSKCCSSGRDN